MRDLLYVPIPYLRESATSLAMRCATHNGHENLRLLLIDGGISSRSFVQQQWRDGPLCRLLCEQPRLDPQEASKINLAFYKQTIVLHKRTIDIAGVNFPVQLLRDELALCPGCIRSGHLNRMHSLLFSEVCPVHGEKFLTRCPECNSAFDWLTIKDFHCPCGFNLRTTQPVIADNTSALIIQSAMDEHDQKFFHLLLAAMSALRYFFTPPVRLRTLDACVKIATGSKAIFFSEMQRLQQLYPSLHRSALVAPFIFSPNETLRNHAIEFFYNTHQSRPTHHDIACDCGRLLFQQSELNFIFGSESKALNLRAEKKCIKHSSIKIEEKVRALFHCPKICATLYEQDDSKWDQWDAPAIPEDDFKLLTCEETAKILYTSANDVKLLVYAGYLRGYRPKSSVRPMVSRSDVMAFHTIFILRSEISARTGLRKAGLRELLKRHTPSLVKSTLYANRIRIYRRNLIPESTLICLDKQTEQLIKPSLTADSRLNYSQVATLLKLELKDITKVIEAGILRTDFIPSTRGRGREFCTGDSVLEAIEWRSNHLTISELASRANCSTNLISFRYRTASFVEWITFTKSLLIHTTHAQKILDHMSEFIVLLDLANEVHRPVYRIMTLTEQNNITPLDSSNPNFLKNYVTFHRKDVIDFIKTYTVIPREARTSTKI